MSLVRVHRSANFFQAEVLLIAIRIHDTPCFVLGYVFIHIRKLRLMEEEMDHFVNLPAFNLISVTRPSNQPWPGKNLWNLKPTSVNKNCFFLELIVAHNFECLCAVGI